MLEEYHWPGNVRESENTIERTLVLAHERTVTKTEIQLRPPSERIGGRWTDQMPIEVGWQTDVSERTSKHLTCQKCTNQVESDPEQK